MASVKEVLILLMFVGLSYLYIYRYKYYSRINLFVLCVDFLSLARPQARWLTRLSAWLAAALQIKLLNIGSYIYRYKRARKQKLMRNHVASYTLY